VYWASITSLGFSQFITGDRYDASDERTLFSEDREASLQVWRRCGRAIQLLTKVIMTLSSQPESTPFEATVLLGDQQPSRLHRLVASTLRHFIKFQDNSDIAALGFL
jgi:hypothetical protein